MARDENHYDSKRAAMTSALGGALHSSEYDPAQDVAERLLRLDHDTLARAMRTFEQMRAGPANKALKEAAGNSPSSEITLDTIDDVMQYQPWDERQTEAGAEVRDLLTLAAKSILRRVPPGRFRSVALRNIIDARMNANAGISFRGRF
jgi:hypothetical protein